MLVAEGSAASTLQQDHLTACAAQPRGKGAKCRAGQRFVNQTDPGARATSGAAPVSPPGRRNEPVHDNPIIGRRREERAPRPAPGSTPADREVRDSCRPHGPHDRSGTRSVKSIAAALVAKPTRAGYPRTRPPTRCATNDAARWLSAQGPHPPDKAMKPPSSAVPPLLVVDDHVVDGRMSLQNGSRRRDRCHADPRRGVRRAQRLQDRKREHRDRR